jgi:hypothetical protein
MDGDRCGGGTGWELGGLTCSPSAPASRPPTLDARSGLRVYMKLALRSSPARPILTRKKANPDNTGGTRRRDLRRECCVKERCLGLVMSWRRTPPPSSHSL